MLGSFEVRVDGSRFGPRDLGGVKPKQLLEVLVLERGRLVPKDRIAELLWGEAPPQRVAATIETYVSVLRRRLGMGLGQGGRVILTEPGGYRVAAEEIAVVSTATRHCCSARRRAARRIAGRR
jgi:SARP family transcriptional regulator, regulator of embCAB operon